MRIQSLALGLLLCGAFAACDSPKTTPKADPAAGNTNVITGPSTAKVGAAKFATAKPSATAAKPPAKKAPDDVAAAPADAKKTASGLAYKVLKEGKAVKAVATDDKDDKAAAKDEKGEAPSEKPGLHDMVRVHYTGWTKAGRMFDSSEVRGMPASFRVSGVIKGWTEGLQLMKRGDRFRFWIPAALAYGERPPPGTPAGQLTFDVQLIDFKPGPKPPPVPEDLTKPPKDALKTASGLRYRYLTKGKGDKAPTKDDYVTVHYSGWTKDGTMFDSSVLRQRPQTFQVGSLIKGWTEGLQLMKTGDKVRMWIPSTLAYGDKPERKGAPAGDLVFDVELIGIRPAPRGGARGGPGRAHGRHDGHGH